MQYPALGPKSKKICFFVIFMLFLENKKIVNKKYIYTCNLDANTDDSIVCIFV